MRTYTINNGEHISVYTRAYLGCQTFFLPIDINTTPSVVLILYPLPSTNSVATDCETE